MTNSEQPINPMPHVNRDGTIQHDIHFGLTKREYFAGLAMQGLSDLINDHADPIWVAQQSVRLADELLKQLEA